MKKLIYIASIACATLFSSCNQDLLDTNPTDMVPGESIFGSADAAQVAVNGVYRQMFMNGWSDSWSSENPGLITMTLVRDLLGEDHLMANQGNGWFYYDYAFNVDSDFTNSSGRQYAQWNLFYTLISQVNYIIDNEETLLSYGGEGKYILGQAYAIRGFAYFCLYNVFCKGNYPVNLHTPGVPIYTEGTSAETEGKPRGTVEELFVQINADFKSSTTYFTEGNVSQKNASNIDKHTAYGMWARVALAQEKWDDVIEYTTQALAKPNMPRVATISELGAFNDASTASIMWGFVVIKDQTGPFGPFLSHMDLTGNYGARAPQCIDAWLWNAIPDADLRKTTWWQDPARANDPEDATFVYAYGQTKFQYANITASEGDVIYMRAEEMVLMAAEAQCRKGNYSAAKALLVELAEKRLEDGSIEWYKEELAKKEESSSYNSNTQGMISTLMDEILLQRRIELWTEGMGRAFDLVRLNLGYTRNYSGSNHTSKRVLEPGDNRFITLIPQKELDSNANMNVSDQNPR